MVLLEFAMSPQESLSAHVARILQKLDLRDRIQAVIFAYESGLVEIGAIEHEA